MVSGKRDLYLNLSLLRLLIFSYLIYFFFQCWHSCLQFGNNTNSNNKSNENDDKTSEKLMPVIISNSKKDSA